MDRCPPKQGRGDTDADLKCIRVDFPSSFEIAISTIGTPGPRQKRQNRNIFEFERSSNGLRNM